MTSSYGLRTLAIHGPDCLGRDPDVHDPVDGESRIVFATSFPAGRWFSLNRVSS